MLGKTGVSDWETAERHAAHGAPSCWRIHGHKRAYAGEFITSPQVHCADEARIETPINRCRHFSYTLQGSRFVHLRFCGQTKRKEKEAKETTKKREYNTKLFVRIPDAPPSPDGPAFAWTSTHRGRGW